MTSFAILRNLDSASWRTATWAAPFAAQLVLGIVIVVYWRLGKSPFELREYPALLAGAAVALLLSAVVMFPLLKSRSPRHHALALAIVGSNVVVLVGGILFGWVYFQW